MTNPILSAALRSCVRQAVTIGPFELDVVGDLLAGERELLEAIQLESASRLQQVNALVQRFAEGSGVDFEVAHNLVYGMMEGGQAAPARPPAALMPYLGELISICQSAAGQTSILVKRATLTLTLRGRFAPHVCQYAFEADHPGDVWTPDMIPPPDERRVDRDKWTEAETVQLPETVLVGIDLFLKAEAAGEPFDVKSVEAEMARRRKPPAATKSKDKGSGGSSRGRGNAVVDGGHGGGSTVAASPE